MTAVRDADAIASRARREDALILCAFAAFGAFYAACVIKDFSGPLIASGDANYFEWLGHHLAKTYRFGVPPTLGFDTHDIGYPFGENVVYQSWCAERDLLHALLLRAFGPGPWLQLYAALSPVVGAVGVYALLKRDLGRRLAGFVGFSASFLAFYAAYKFPYHANMQALHWGSMSIAVDYLFARRVFRRERIEARLLLARAALLVLVIGLDIAYVAGYPLTSFTVTTLVLATWMALRGRRSGYGFREALPASVRTVADEARAHRFAFTFWSAAFVLGLVVYVPFAFAIVRESRIYRFGDAGGNFWASQLRLLLPFFPGANPASDWAVRLFGDADGVAEFSTGWALVALFVLGVVAAKRKGTLPMLAPTLVTFALCFAFYPKQFPTLHIFPWFFFNRVAGRATVFFPLWFALVGVEWLQTATKRAMGALAALGAVELATAYLLVPSYVPLKLTAEMRGYFDAIRSAPGEALLEWPFCIGGSNGVGTAELCPYYEPLHTSYAYRRFHDKKVIGFFPSRLHPSQLESRIAWRDLFSPDDPDPQKAKRETRCFDPARWSQFDSLFRSADFAGIQLDTDFLPRGCADEFHRRYGAASAATWLPGPGRVEFIARRSGGPAVVIRQP